MQRHLLSKLIQSVLLLFGVLLLLFLGVRMTGDPARLMMPREATSAEVESFREAMGFNRPVLVQFWDFLTKAIQGDFGKSLHYKIPAMELVLGRLPATLQLASVALLYALLVAIPLGIIGGFHPGSLADSFGRLVALLGQSVPNFWLAMMMIVLFAVRLHWFPSFGRFEWKSVIMPAFVLGLPIMSRIVRLTRSSVLEIRSEDFIRTAYSKGLDPRVIYVKHVFRNVLIPLVSVIGVSFGYLLGGSIYIEAVFAWPGAGQLIEQAIGWRDFPLIQAIAVFVSVVVIALNLLTDIAYVIIDPRIRYGERTSTSN
jgi:ABC-type dipeptide/oligopeptide/nickel transport system permease component